MNTLCLLRLQGRTGPLSRPTTLNREWRPTGRMKIRYRIPLQRYLPLDQIQYAITLFSYSEMILSILLDCIHTYYVLSCDDSLP